MTPNDQIAENDVIQRKRHAERTVRFYNIRLSERDAWLGAIVAALFNALGMLLELVIVKSTPGISPKPAAISALIALMLLVVLFIWRKTPSVKWASIVYSVTTVSVVTVLLLSNVQFAVSEKHWVPFQASKLGCLIAAVLAPGFWVGLLSILAYCLSALLQFQFFFPPEIRTQVDAGEPWPILAFGLAGVLALVYRFRRAQLEQEVAQIHAQNFAIRELANAFLSIRDLMNTPLQVIEVAVELLRNSNKPAKSILDHIERSVQSLREINSMLAQHEKDIESEAKR
jgi:hypothetical protein